MSRVASALFFLVGVVNFVPVIGVLSAERLESLYGVILGGDPNLIILMRHRAVLFGIVGGLLIAAVFRRPLRPAALAAGLVSMLSFVLIAYLVGDFGAPLRRVVVIDVVASVMLIGAGWIHRSTDSRGA